MSTDWMWCYENPKAAAHEIDRLRGELSATTAERDRAQVACEQMGRAVAAEREACCTIIKARQPHDECDYRQPMDPETGEVPCSRRGGCLCDDLAEYGDSLVAAIRTRGTE